MSLQRSHHIRNFGVKAQLDFIMPPWDPKIFELEMRRTTKRLVGESRILAGGNLHKLYDVNIY